VIFVFTIGAKFLGRDTFDKLPDFLKNSYSALWSAGAVAGGALVGSVIDALSKRESNKGSFILYIMGTAILIMILIVGTVELSRSIDEPRFTVPAGATAIPTSNTSSPLSFYLQNHVDFGNQAHIRGTYQIKDGLLTGEVVDSELEPVPPGVMPANLPLTQIRVHVCYFGAENHIPLNLLVPKLPDDSNREPISTNSNMQQPFPIPNFKFKIDINHLSYVAPPYLCAFVDTQQSYYHLTYY